MECNVCAGPDAEVVELGFGDWATRTMSLCTRCRLLFVPDTTANGVRRFQTP